MGLFDTVTKLKPETDPNFFSTVDSRGQADPIIEVLLLDDNLVIHTESSLSTLSTDFKIVNRFADVEIGTNLVKDGTAIVGASSNNVYLTAYSREQGGYSIYDLNKEFKDIKPISYLVDLLDSQRIVFLCPENSKEIYVLSQETDRRFKGFTKFQFPVEIVRAFRETFRSIVLIDKNNNVYGLSFVTDKDTDFTDTYVNDENQEVKQVAESSLRWTPIIAVDAHSTTFFSEQTAGRIGLGIHGTPRMRLEFVSEGRDRDYTDFKDITPDSVGEEIPGVPATPGTPGTPGTEPTEETVYCDSRRWRLGKPVKSFGIDFTRGFLFALFNDDRVKLLDFRSGTGIGDIEEWGEFTSENGKLMRGTVDIKCRTDNNVEVVDYVPYFMDNGTNLTTLDYDAETNRMVQRSVYSGSGNAKSFCFLSDNIIAVLTGTTIRVIDIKRQNDEVLADIDITEIIGDDVPIAIESMQNSFIAVLTQRGIFRIKISSMSGVLGESLLFIDSFRSFLGTPYGLVINNNEIYTMSKGLHSISIIERLIRSSRTRNISITAGRTSEVKDAPECGVSQIASKVTLIDGHTTSPGAITTPVDTGNPSTPGTMDSGDVSQPSLGSEQVESVSPGEAGAFAIGVGDQKLEIVTRSSDGDLNSHPYSFTNANPPVFTAGTSETPHSSITDIKAIFPASGDRYVVTGDGDVVLFSNGNKPSNLNHSDMPERVDVAGIQEDVIIMISGTTLRLFSYAQNTISKLSQFTLKSASGIRGVFRSRGYIFIVRTGKLEAYNAFDGTPAKVFSGGNTYTFSASAVAYHGTNIWYLDGGEVKRRPLRQTSRTTPGSEIIAISSSEAETTEFTGFGDAGVNTYIYSGEGSRRHVAPLFWDAIYQLKNTWERASTVVYHYSNWVTSKFEKAYEFVSKRSLDKTGQSMPAGPQTSSMFVDEYRVRASNDRPVFLGKGHFPSCMSIDGDHLYIPWYEGDVVAYNLKDKEYGYNRGLRQIDPVVGSKLSYQVAIQDPKRPGSYSIQYLYNLLASRAGVAANLADLATYEVPVSKADRESVYGGFMGGVSAMTSLINGNIFYRMYGVSKSYNIENGWTANNTIKDRARNTGRKTGKTLNYRKADDDPQGSLVNDRKPYIIFEFKDKRSVTRTHPAGDAKNNEVFDKDWVLTGGAGVDSNGQSNLIGNYELGAATYNPSFPGHPARVADRYKQAVFQPYVLRNIISRTAYRADARYNYRLISSSRWPAGGKITCLFHDITNLYAVIQPPESGKAKLYKIAFADIGTNGLDIKLTSQYETHNGWTRGKEKSAASMEIGRWFEVRVDTADYGDMAETNTFDRMPHFQYFDSIEWDEVK